MRYWPSKRQKNKQKTKTNPKKNHPQGHCIMAIIAKAMAIKITQRIAVAVQRGNAASYTDSLPLSTGCHKLDEPV